MTPITRWQAERSGWQEAVNAEETKLAITIQQIKAILHTFKDQDRIKDIMDIDQFIDPMTEKVEDLINGTNLVEDIIASYSLTPEDVPNEEIDPVVLIRPGQALAAIQTLREWELQQDDSTQEVIRQLRTLEKRVKREQFTELQQITLTSYFL
jgi:phosphoenolpyruvate carboxylase